MKVGFSLSESVATVVKHLSAVMALILATLGVAVAAPLNVEKVEAHSGTVVSAHLMEQSDRLYVSGLVRLHKPNGASPGAHVDVYLMSQSGQILQQQKSRILITSQRAERTRNRQFSYAVSFVSKQALQASTVRVVYCANSHKEQES